MTSRAKSEYRYEKLTWPEINDAVEMGKVCVVPCGAVEQHGPHLPLDVDIICPTEIARGAGKDVTFHLYPGTKHWFFEEDRPSDYNPEAAHMAWNRTLEFLNSKLR